MSLGLSPGLLAVTDLRLIGFMRGRPVSDLLLPLRPWMLAGFALTFISGGLLFWSEAADVYVKPLFRLKLLFMAVAGANALYFELRMGRRVAEWDLQAVPPAAARFAGWTSLICWAATILCGRWVAYGI